METLTWISLSLELKCSQLRLRRTNGNNIDLLREKYFLLPFSASAEAN